MADAAALGKTEPPLLLWTVLLELEFPPNVASVVVVVITDELTDCCTWTESLDPGVTGVFGASVCESVAGQLLPLFRGVAGLSSRGKSDNTPPGVAG